MLSVFILTLIQSSFSLTDDSTALPQNQLQLTEYGEYVTFIDEELHIPIISTGRIETLTFTGSYKPFFETRLPVLRLSLRLLFQI